MTTLDLFETHPAADRLRRHSFDLLRLPPGAAVVDVGCGTGRAVADLAESGAAAVGVDLDPAMIDVARARHPGGDFRVGDARDLPFGAGELAGYRADKVLHDLPDLPAALREAHRVLAAGGRLVAVDLEWDAVVVASDDPIRTRTLVHARTDALPTGFAARQAPDLLRDLGFTDVTTTAETIAITAGDLGLGVIASIARTDPTGTWLDEQQRRAAAGRLLVAVPILVIAATRS